MSKIPLEILYRLDEKITNLPLNGKLRRELINEVALCYQLSETNGYLRQFATEIANKKHRSQNLTRHQVWKTNLPVDVDLSVCSYEHYSLLLREPVERHVKSDATVQFNRALEIGFSAGVKPISKEVIDQV